jgi:hypothetical protein
MTGPPCTRVTVIVALPLFPSLVAVIVADPSATLVTRPVLDTLATAAAEVDQLTLLPATALPLASFGVAVS